MVNREVLEKLALEEVCACLYYDLADNIEIESDDTLLAITEHTVVCDICGKQKKTTLCVKIGLMSRKIVNMQVKVSEAVKDRAKAVAKANGKTLSELVLKLLANAGDKELKSLVEQELKERPKPGRPWDK